MAKRTTVSLKIPPKLYSCVNEVGRHLRANGYDVQREGEYAVSLLVTRYIKRHREDFDQKGEGQYVCVAEDADPDPLPADDDNNADEHPVIEPTEGASMDGGDE